MLKISLKSKLSFLLLGLLMVAGCCHKTIHNGVIAVREGRWRMEKQLPLTAPATDSILQFIKWGGDTEDPGGSSSPVLDSSYIRFLALLSHPNKCFMDSLVKSPEFSLHVASTTPREDVYDSRKDEGPDVEGRHAFLFNDNFLMIFFVEDNDEGPETIKYDILIVQKQFREVGGK